MNSAQIISGVFFLALTAWPIWIVAQIVRESRASKRRIARWMELRDRAARGDRAALVELLETGPERNK